MRRMRVSIPRSASLQSTTAPTVTNAMLVVTGAEFLLVHGGNALGRQEW